MIHTYIVVTITGSAVFTLGALFIGATLKWRKSSQPTK